MKTFLYIFIAFTVFLSCKTQKETTEAKPVEEKTTTVTTPQSADSLLASIERTACYGTCPIYKFTIYNSGYAIYEGKRFVEKEGKFEMQISASVLDEIRTKAQAINYFEFKDEYPKKASDFPAVKTAVVLDGKRKEIMDGSGAPSSLKDFEKYIDSLKDSVEWRQIH